MKDRDMPGIGKNRITFKIWLLICIITIYPIGFSSTIQNEVLNAVNKSTTISCDDPWRCNKTVCIDGECTTTKTNSSEIIDIDVPSSLTEEDIDIEEDIGDSDDSNGIEDLIEERLNMRR